ncbi:MAG TPA: GNAT family N-acetyltransferase [Acidimicrobiales bacterium]|nr:GNAT family N-acetyltransferase [Acidimicrobiales bacterium]
MTESPTTLFHSPEWCAVLADTYGFSPEANVLLDESGVPRAGFVYVRIEDAMDPRVVSLPFSDFCDPIVRDLSDWEALSSDLIGADQRIHLRCVHSDVPLADPRFETAGKARWHAIDVDRDLDDIWSALHSGARQSIRKARNEGVEIRVAQDKGDLRSFFDLHLAVRKRKYRLLAQPFRFFEQIWDHLVARDRGVLLLGLHKGRVVSGIMFLEWQHSLFYKFNASDNSLLSARPNDVLIWAGIEHARSRGLRSLDFGVSDWDQEGLLRYKRKYATVEKTVSFLQRMPEGAPSMRERQLRGLLPQLTSVLVDPTVPDAATEAAGDVLYRLFV